jgi:hypothetical protein
MPVGCGGGGTSPTAPATPLPTPTPVNYNGTYTGTSMTWTNGRGQLHIAANTTLTHTGSNLSFSDMRVTSPAAGTFGMGAAVLTGNTFDGTSQYSSSGCGTVTSHYRGYFSGDGGIMNMTMTLTSSCDHTDEIRGEMRR